MISGVAAKRLSPGERLSVYRIIGQIHKLLVAPGAAGVLVSGGFLLMPFMGRGGLPGWLHLMLATGVLGALVALFLSLPTASRLARLELDPRGELPESFHGLRKRQAIVATVAGGLGIVALISLVGWRHATHPLTV
jgi:hypothetical protein